MRAFISYSHSDRKYGTQAKEVLEIFGIEGFLAHEDLEMSELWRKRILEELSECELFVPILSKDFLSSKWAPQEIGFIASRPDVVVAPLSIDGTVPFGFIDQIQSGNVLDGKITRDLLILPLVRNLPRVILPRLIDEVAGAGSFRRAEDLMLPLVPYFSDLTVEEAQTLAEASVKNGQIWSAALCNSEYLPKFIQAQGSQINPGTLRALRYQVENNHWYRGEGGAEA